MSETLEPTNLQLKSMKGSEIMNKDLSILTPTAAAKKPPTGKLKPHKKLHKVSPQMQRKFQKNLSNSQKKLESIKETCHNDVLDNNKLKHSLIKEHKRARSQFISYEKTVFDIQNDEEAAKRMFERTDNEHLLNNLRSVGKTRQKIEFARLDKIQNYHDRMIRIK